LYIHSFAIHIKKRIVIIDVLGSYAVAAVATGAFTAALLALAGK
jgi:hypothetical protein